MWLRVRAVSYG
uniref:Uncharacterized protein n=1 Tax=Anopheles quadriannulatus TaxID=34691 RepID=A0A182XS22_ANOQN